MSTRQMWEELDQLRSYCSSDTDRTINPMADPQVVEEAFGFLAWLERTVEA